MLINKWILNLWNHPLTSIKASGVHSLRDQAWGPSQLLHLRQSKKKHPRKSYFLFTSTKIPPASPWRPTSGSKYTQCKTLLCCSTKTTSLARCHWSQCSSEPTLLLWWQDLKTSSPLWTISKQRQIQRCGLILSSASKSTAPRANKRRRICLRNTCSNNIWSTKHRLSLKLI